MFAAPSSHRHCFWCFILIPVAFGEPSPAQEMAPLASVEKRLSLRDALFNTLSARANVSTEIRNTKRGRFSHKAEVFQVTVNEKGWYSGTIEDSGFLDDDSANDTAPFVFQTVKNEKEARKLYKADNGRLVGVITADSPLEVHIHPLRAACLGPWSITEWLDRSYKFIDGEETVDGRLTVRLSWEATRTDKPGSIDRGTYWLAPDLAYAPVRSVTKRKPDATLPEREVGSMVFSNYVERGGLFLPGRVSLETNKYYDDGYFELYEKATIIFSDWESQQTVGRKSYELIFPEGTLVNNLAKGGVTYLEGRITDAKLAEQIAMARTLASSTEADLLREFNQSRGAVRAHHRATLIFYAVVLGILVLTLIILIWVLFLPKLRRR